MMYGTGTEVRRFIPEPNFVSSLIPAPDPGSKKHLIPNTAGLAKPSLVYQINKEDIEILPRLLLFKLFHMEVDAKACVFKRRQDDWRDILDNDRF